MSSIPTELPKTKIRSECLSKYGKWRSFPKVPNLLQYVAPGTADAVIPGRDRSYGVTLKAKF